MDRSTPQPADDPDAINPMRRNFLARVAATRRERDEASAGELQKKIAHAFGYPSPVAMTSRVAELAAQRRPR